MTRPGKRPLGRAVATRPECWSLGRVIPSVDDFSSFSFVFEDGFEGWIVCGLVASVVVGLEVVLWTIG